MANNKIEIVFNRDFTLGDQTKQLVQISGSPILYNFQWVNTPTSGFEVEVGTPTATTGETTAINFKTAWENSLSGYTVNQSANTVTITGDDTVEFLDFQALDSGNNSYLIPTDYEFTISTETNSLKITYSDKVGTTIPGDAVNQWRDDDANEVKDKHNDTVDVVLQNQSDLDTKANLSGGNTISDAQTFTGTVNIDGKLEVDDDIEIIQANKGLYLNGANNRIFFSNNRALEGNSAGTALTLGEEYDLTRVLNDFSAFGVVTFGTSGQSNTLVILGDTGEDLTITKNLDGTLTISNTNNENVIIDGALQVKGAGSGVLTFEDEGAALSKSMVYDGTTDEFTLQTDTAIQGDLTASNIVSDNNISLSGGLGDFISRDGSTGFTGTFESLAGDTVTVKNGIITSVS